MDRQAVRTDFWKIFDIDDQFAPGEQAEAEARRRARGFASTWQRHYPAAVECASTILVGLVAHLHFPRAHWGRGCTRRSGQQRTHLDRDRQVEMIPDLLFSNSAGRVVLVADTKYKLTDEGVGGAADHYQLLAYCIRHATTDGVLLYAAGDGPGPLRTVTVGHEGIRLHSIGVDLAGPPERIEASIARIADLVSDIAAGRRVGG